ncbi:MAG: undecaprenyl-diphosphate phosphatase [Actinomycetota bacterium]|nr:undecaprenyl-diphosphate phosphatase [Actinomycetota bacterium]
MSRRRAALRIADSRAALLGAVQGPTELLPVSSSAHISLLPYLAGWEWQDLDAEARKSFEVALHGGTAAALLVCLRHEIAGELGSFDLRRASVVALSFITPAVAGVAFERHIEALGTPRATAAGLVVGAAAMAAADASPQERGRGDANALDGFLLGLAQACALVPGVSRNGATLTAARARRFDRAQANLLSRTVALPVILGAVGLKGTRLARRGLAPGTGRALAIGGAAAFASTLASQRLIRLVERDRALWPYAAYRFVLAACVLRRARAVESPP